MANNTLRDGTPTEPQAQGWLDWAGDKFEQNISNPIKLKYRRYQQEERVRKLHNQGNEGDSDLSKIRTRLKTAENTASKEAEGKENALNDAVTALMPDMPPGVTTKQVKLFLLNELENNGNKAAFSVAILGLKKFFEKDTKPEGEQTLEQALSIEQMQAQNLIADHLEKSPRGNEIKNNLANASKQIREYGEALCLQQRIEAYQQDQTKFESTFITGDNNFLESALGNSDHRDTLKWAETAEKLLNDNPSEEAEKIINRYDSSLQTPSKASEPQNPLATEAPEAFRIPELKDTQNLGDLNQCIRNVNALMDSRDNQKTLIENLITNPASDDQLLLQSALEDFEKTESELSDGIENAVDELLRLGHNSAHLKLQGEEIDRILLLLQYMQQHFKRLELPIQTMQSGVDMAYDNRPKLQQYLYFDTRKPEDSLQYLQNADKKLDVISNSTGYNRKIDSRTELEGCTQEMVGRAYNEFLNLTKNDKRYGFAGDTLYHLIGIDLDIRGLSVVRDDSGAIKKIRFADRKSLDKFVSILKRLAQEQTNKTEASANIEPVDDQASVESQTKDTVNDTPASETHDGQQQETQEQNNNGLPQGTSGYQPSESSEEDEEEQEDESSLRMGSP